MRLLGVLAVLAAILTAFLGRAIAGGMRAFVSIFLCHKQTPLSGKVCAFTTDPKTQNTSGQGWNDFRI
jgi:hypothetical protein